MIKAVLAGLYVIAFALLALAVETWRAARKGVSGLDDRSTAFLMLVAACLVVLLALAFGRVAHGRDLGQWEGSDPGHKQWFQNLMQPDSPASSCCGEADAYYARGGKAYCKVTDDRDDAPRGRPHVEIGTEIEIPDHKLKWDRSNPTGHGIVFLSRNRYVFCYVQPDGV